jgi:pyruvate,water dikinase
MVDITRPWVVDNELSDRWPVYTRGNVGEVSSTAATPLFWSMVGGPPAEREWKQALAEFGAFDLDEFRTDVIDIQGLVHGYVYLNLSNMRTFGARMPGATPDLMDRTYLGDRAAPPYVPHEDDDKPEYTERILATVQRVLGETARPDVEAHRGIAEDLRSRRPDLQGLTERELVARSRMVMNEVYPPFIRTHLRMVYEGSVVTGALDDALAPLGDPSLAVALMGGLGNIASAAPNEAMWKLGRRVADSASLTAEFDQGVQNLDGRLRESTDAEATAFVKEFDDFLYRFGSRSTQEWEVNAKTWETHPGIPLGMIDRMRLQPEDKSPAVQGARLRAEREAMLADMRARLASLPDQLAAVEQVLNSVAVYSQAREQSKTNTIRVMHEARLCMVELGARYARQGIFQLPEDIVMVREDELDALVDDPGAFAGTISERWEWWHALSELEPPVIVEKGKIPPVSEWRKRRESGVELAGAGEVLKGLSACAGVATGRARIIEDPEDGVDLQPGEILVAPWTDPGWTPLFTSAEAVVVNVGSSMSHAAIVSRELGIPCVLGVTDATKRITDGTMLTVDGGAGTVTVH